MKSSYWTRVAYIVSILAIVLLLYGCSGGSVGRIIIDAPSDSVGFITGSVKSWDEIDLSEVLVMIREIKMTSMPDASGQFSLEKVPTGKRTIYAETAKHLSWPVTVTVQKDKVIDIGPLYLFEEPPLPPAHYYN